MTTKLPDADYLAMQLREQFTEVAYPDTPKPYHHIPPDSREFQYWRLMLATAAKILSRTSNDIFQ